MTGWPLSFGFGQFPVPLTTFIGQPIVADPSLTARELADKVAHTLQVRGWDILTRMGWYFEEGGVVL